MYDFNNEENRETENQNYTWDVSSQNREPEKKENPFAVLKKLRKEGKKEVRRIFQKDNGSILLRIMLRPVWRLRTLCSRSDIRFD